ncbi:MAG: S8 family serine peptidase [Bacteroidota bacterium]
MIIKHILIAFLFSISLLTTGQSRYWVCFSNKKDVSFDPFKYFDAKAIERRIVNDIPLIDSTDFPLNQNYIGQIQQIANEMGFESRWFNAVSVDASDEQIDQIRNLSFVNGIYTISSSSQIMENDFDTSLTTADYDLLKKQTSRMQGDLFEKNGFTGKGIRIAIFDGGFPTVDTSPVFEHIRKENRIIKTFDFTKKKEFVYSYMSHGTSVMSCIGGKINDIKIGLAVDAEFLLAKTEVVSEPFKEEENWLAAAEWADKNGAQIINSSLGYTYQRYFYKDMDGQSTFVTKAANMAASKGILVVNAAGNEGSNKWKYIGAPADADSVLSVGGINPYSDYHTSFSSFGPTYDKRLKPNVCAFGHVIVAGKGDLHETQGTSFASPLVAGFAACALQTDPNMGNMQLFNEIEKSGDLYPYFDYAHGYGVPQASYFTDSKKEQVDPTFLFLKEGDYLNVMIENQIFDPQSTSYLYYHIQNEKGIIDYYAVINVYQNEALKIYLPDIKGKKIIRVHYKKYTEEYQITN